MWKHPDPSKFLSLLTEPRHWLVSLTLVCNHLAGLKAQTLGSTCPSITHSLITHSLDRVTHHRAQTIGAEVESNHTNTVHIVLCCSFFRGNNIKILGELKLLIYKTIFECWSLGTYWVSTRLANPVSMIYFFIYLFHKYEQLKPKNKLKDSPWIP